MTTLIGLNGRRGAGKDTAFGFVQEWAAERGLRAARRGFADALKFSFARIFIPDCSLDEAVIWCDELKNELSRSRMIAEWTNGFHGKGETETTIQHTITGRQALQRYGTEGHRDVFGDDFWVDALLPTHSIINEHDLPEGPAWPYNFIAASNFSGTLPDLAVVTDTRFVNEAKRIRALRGHILEVYRGGLKDDDGHASEVPLPADLIDATVYNSAEGEPEQMRQQIYVHLDCLMGREDAE